MSNPISTPRFNFMPTPLAGAFLIEPKLFEDARGLFFRTFCAEEFAAIDHIEPFAQMNHSLTRGAGTVRGMHFQYPPHAEIKTVRCVAGRIFDVIIDLRQNSATFLQWWGTELSTANKRTMYIPKGFAHGFQTLTENCELVYCHTAVYHPAHEGGVRYDDPRVGIQWPMIVNSISERDASYVFLSPEFKGLIA